jgi:hypothetical protein
MCTFHLGFISDKTLYYKANKKGEREKKILAYKEKCYANCKPINVFIPFLAIDGSG